MKFLASLLSFDTLDKNGEIKEADPAAFDAAVAAIDRAAKERAKTSEPRNGEERRRGLPDTRSTGFSERRTGIDRRDLAPQSFGRRGK